MSSSSALSVLFAFCIFCSCFVRNAASVQYHFDKWTLSESNDHLTPSRRSEREAGFNASSPTRCFPKCATIMLPCDFPPFDPCLIRQCREQCRADENRVVNNCQCQTLGNVTYRSCFCAPSPSAIEQALSTRNRGGSGVLAVGHGSGSGQGPVTTSAPQRGSGEDMGSENKTVERTTASNVTIES